MVTVGAEKPINIKKVKKERTKIWCALLISYINSGGARLIYAQIYAQICVQIFGYVPDVLRDRYVDVVVGWLSYYSRNVYTSNKRQHLLRQLGKTLFRGPELYC